MIVYPFVVNGVTTRVLEAGRGPDVIVFIHGLGARADRWSATLQAFAGHGYRCLALDLPGHGFAAKGEGIPSDVPGFARFLSDFLNAMNVERAFLIGTSLGGHIAAYFTCTNPVRPRALVLVGSVGLIPLGAEAGAAIGRNVSQTSREAIAKKMEFVFANANLITAELIEEEYRINNSHGATGAFQRLGDYIASEIDRDNVGERLKVLVGQIPMLLVWGDCDKAVPPRIGKQTQALLESVELVMIPGAGHAPYLESPTLFNRRVLRFLALHRP
jgi:2-hydroxy-6-oxonona-2,4-dienedioate hydrolase